MPGKRKKVFVAISGGVDSSTAAALLLQRGYDCAGVFMITHDRAEKARQQAEQAAKQLGMDFYVLDVRKEFAAILDYFCSEYRQARTPNPCVLCNKQIKFGRVWDFAAQNGADLLATGHYARVIGEPDDLGLYAAADEAKDQSYALAMIDRSILQHIILPMGDYTKQQTREIARSLGLCTAESEESQEICFVPDNDYAGLLERLWPQVVRKGHIVDSAGRVLGEHDGIHRFTIGQRRGAKVAMGKPWYVVRLNAEDNTVTLGPKEEVMHKQLMATAVNWLIDGPAQPFHAKVKIRYNGTGADATVAPMGPEALVEFDKPVWAITPGQLVVFYIRCNGSRRVAGAGWINGPDAV